MLKVSVVMTAYNGEKYIEKQLDSILSQHRLPDEVIIIDDCSSDNTPKIIKKYIEDNSLNNWFFEINGENLGFKKNFKKALSKISGDICFLCDQDDIWCDDKIETGVALFSDDTVFGISTGFSVIDGEENDITKSILSNGTYAFTDEKLNSPLLNIKLKNIMHQNISPGCTCAYRKNVVDLYLKNANDELPHDYQLDLISSALSGFVFYNVPLNKYRIHSKNTLGIKPLNQTRLEIAEEKLNLSRVIKDISDESKALNRLCEKRYAALFEKSLRKTFLLNFIREYKQYYSFKERIGDILYAVK